MSVKVKAKEKRHARKARKHAPGKPLLSGKDFKRSTKHLPKRKRSLRSAPTANLFAAYLEFPARLAACRSPFDLWLAHAQLTHQIITAAQSIAFGRAFVLPLPIP